MGQIFFTVNLKSGTPMEPSGNRAPTMKTGVLVSGSFFRRAVSKQNTLSITKTDCRMVNGSTTVMIVPKDARRITAMDKDTDRKWNTEKTGCNY